MISRGILLTLLAGGTLLAFPLYAKDSKDIEKFDSTPSPDVMAKQENVASPNSDLVENSQIIPYQTNQQPAWAPVNQYELLRDQMQQKSEFVRVGYGVSQSQHRRYRSKFQFDNRKIGILMNTCYRDSIAGVLSGVFVGSLPRQLQEQNGQTKPLIEAVAGNELGRFMDNTDAQCANQVLERARDGQQITWRNPNTGRRYQIKPDVSYRRKDSRYCRHYIAEVKSYADTQNYDKSACRSDGGVWEMQN